MISRNWATNGHMGAVEPFVFRKPCTNDLIVSQEKSFRHAHIHLTAHELTRRMAEAVSDGFRVASSGSITRVFCLFGLSIVYSCRFFSTSLEFKNLQSGTSRLNLLPLDAVYQNHSFMRNLLNRSTTFLNQCVFSCRAATDSYLRTTAREDDCCAAFD